MEIIAEIKEIDKHKKEFICSLNGREIRVDACVGCNLPHDFFTIFQMERLIGKNYTFEGEWYSQDNSLFLSCEMSVPIDETER